MNIKDIKKQVKKQVKQLFQKVDFIAFWSKIQNFLKIHFTNTNNIKSVKIMVLNGVVVFMVLFQVSTINYTWSIEL